MSAIDEILATGRYTDKRGRVWEIPFDPYERFWVLADSDAMELSWGEMRLLIERDQHRVVCPNIQECWDRHPVARVETRNGMYFTYGPLCGFHEEMFDTLAAAMDAARALAVES